MPRMSKHIIAKSCGYPKGSYVDFAGLDGRIFTLPREASVIRQVADKAEESAEAIVVDSIAAVIRQLAE